MPISRQNDHQTPLERELDGPTYGQWLAFRDKYLELIAAREAELPANDTIPPYSMDEELFWWHQGLTQHNRLYPAYNARYMRELFHG